MSARVQTLDWLNFRIDELEEREKLLRSILVAASHGLRSYQYGNASTDLAEEMADHIDIMLANQQEAKQ